MSSAARTWRMTSSGRLVRSNQVNRRTVQPALTSWFCFVRSRWKRSGEWCQAQPSISIANRSVTKAMSTVVLSLAGFRA